MRAAGRGGAGSAIGGTGWEGVGDVVGSESGMVEGEVGSMQW